MRVSMLFSKRPMILVIPSSFFSITASDAPHVSLLSVPCPGNGAGAEWGGRTKGNQDRSKSD